MKKGELSATCVAPRVPLRLRSLSPNQQRGLIELYSQKYAKGGGSLPAPWVRFRLTIRAEISQAGTGTHGPSCGPHGGPEELCASCHIIYRSRTLATKRGSSSSIKWQQVASTARRSPALLHLQHTNPSRGAIEATGDRCAILRLRLSRQQAS